MLVGLVRDPGWGPEPPDDDERPKAPWPKPPWQPFAWVAVFFWLLYAAGEIGGFAGYLVVLLAIALGCWRIDKWLAKQYWGGLTKR